jgi:tetratricopeptide (TPR) repeat protein
MSYVIDPTTPYIEFSQDEAALDYLSFPRQSLDYRAGDCDDLSILFSALLQSIGIEAAFITVPGHIYTAFSLSMDPDKAKKIFLKPEDFIFMEDETWLPVEITLLNEGFLRAWQVGAKQWRDNIDSGDAGFYPIRAAWSIYEPAGLPGEQDIELVSETEIRDQYIAELNRFIEREIFPQVEKLQQAIKQNNEPKYINQLGVVYARFGLLEEAERAFQQATVQQDYLPALANLGNIYFMQTAFDKALEYFQQGYSIDSTSASVLLGLTRTHYELENHTRAREAYNELSVVKPKLAEKYSYLFASEEGSTRASEALKSDVEWDEGM